MKSKTTQKKIINAVIYLIFAILLFLLLLPLISMFGTAIKTHDAALMTTSLFPENKADFSLENFGFVMIKMKFGKNLLNSAIVRPDMQFPGLRDPILRRIRCYCSYCRCFRSC